MATFEEVEEALLTEIKDRAGRGASTDQLDELSRAVWHLSTARRDRAKAIAEAKFEGT